MTVESRIAGVIVEEALGRVFEPAIVGGLRPDSPLAVLGVTPADVICIAEAISAAATVRGIDCDLGDTDLAAALTVADLVNAVTDAGSPGGGA